MSSESSRETTPGTRSQYNKAMEDIESILKSQTPYESVPRPSDLGFELTQNIEEIASQKSTTQASKSEEKPPFESLRIPVSLESWAEKERVFSDLDMVDFSKKYDVDRRIMNARLFIQNWLKKRDKIDEYDCSETVIQSKKRDLEFYTKLVNRMFNDWNKILNLLRLHYEIDDVRQFDIMIKIKFHVKSKSNSLTAAGSTVKSFKSSKSAVKTTDLNENSEAEIIDLSESETQSNSARTIQRTTATTRQLNEVRKRQKSLSKFDQIVRDIQKKWVCEFKDCFFFSKEVCWVEYDEKHVQLASTDLKSWANSIQKRDSTKFESLRKLTKKWYIDFKKKTSKLEFSRIESFELLETSPSILIQLIMTKSLAKNASNSTQSVFYSVSNYEYQIRSFSLNLLAIQMYRKSNYKLIWSLIHSRILSRAFHRIRIWIDRVVSLILTRSIHSLTLHRIHHRINFNFIQQLSRITSSHSLVSYHSLASLRTRFSTNISRDWVEKDLKKQLESWKSRKVFLKKILSWISFVIWSLSRWMRWTLKRRYIRWFETI